MEIPVIVNFPNAPCVDIGRLRHLCHGVALRDVCHAVALYLETLALETKDTTEREEMEKLALTLYRSADPKRRYARTGNDP